MEKLNNNCDLSKIKVIRFEEFNTNESKLDKIASYEIGLDLVGYNKNKKIDLTKYGKDIG